MAKIKRKRKTDDSRPASTPPRWMRLLLLTVAIGATMAIMSLLLQTRSSNIPQLPDLRVTVPNGGMTCSAYNPYRFSIRIENAGTITAENIEIMMNQQPVITLVQLEPDQHRTISYEYPETWDMNTPFDYTVTVDPNDTITELAEGNNIYYGRRTVLIPCPT